MMPIIRPPLSLMERATKAIMPGAVYPVKELKDYEKIKELIDIIRDFYSMYNLLPGEDRHEN